MKRTKVKIISIIVVVMALVAIAAAFVFAGNDVKYLFSVVEDGTDQAKKDEQVMIHRKVDKTKSTQTELKLETIIKNETKAKREVAILMDTSKSMSSNLVNMNIYDEVKKFIGGLYDNVDVTEMKVSVCNNTTKKTMVTTKDAAQKYPTSQNFPEGQGSDLREGLKNAQESFSKPAAKDNDDVERFLVIFTDATDEVKSELETLKNLQDIDVNIVSILIDISSNSYIDGNGNAVAGIVKEISSGEQAAEEEEVETKVETDYSDIYAEIERSMENIVLEDMLSDKAMDYFTLELCDDENTDEEVKIQKEQTKKGKDSGIKITIDKLAAQEEKTIKYKLILKRNINNVMNIEDVWGKPVETHSDLKITYDYMKEKVEGDQLEKTALKREEKEKVEENGEKTLDTKSSPTIQIGKGFKVTLIAVNENSKDVPVEGIKFKVKAVEKIHEEDADEGEEVAVAEPKEPKVILKETEYTTTSTGKIELDDLFTTEDIEFEVTPIVENKPGYVYTAPAQFTVEYNALTRERKLDSIDFDWEYEYEHSNVNIYYPINVLKFDLEVDLQDETNSSTKIGDSTFKLVQPKLNNKVEMAVLTATTDKNGVLHFNATAMTKDGTYDYFLSQETLQNGYESIGVAKISITFKDGKITNVEPKNAPQVTCDTYKEDYAKLIVGNKNLSTEKFELLINSMDIDTGDAIPNVEYMVELNINSNWIKYEGIITDKSGVAKVELMGAGDVLFRITEVTPNPAYVADPQTKKLLIHRDNGTVEYIKSNPDGLDAVADDVNNRVVVDMYSERKLEQNVIRIHLTDLEQNIIPLQNTVVQLKDRNTQMIYTGQTDVNGLVDIILPNQPKGTYTYDIEIPTIPGGYTYDTKASIEVEFDENQRIDITNLPTIVSPIMKIEKLDEQVELERNRGFFVELGLTFKYTEGCEFKIKLESSSTNPTQVIPGAVYNVDMVITLDDGSTIFRNLVNATTDSNGEISTKIIKGTKIDITVVQVSTIKGYKIDKSVQEINIEVDENKQFKLIKEKPHSSSDKTGISTSINEGVITYNHKNSKKTADDTYLNLLVVKEDTEGGLASGIGVKVKTTDGRLINTKTGEPLKDSPLFGITNELGEVKWMYPGHSDNCACEQNNGDDCTCVSNGYSCECGNIQVQGIIYDGNGQTYELSIIEYDLATKKEIPSSEVKYRIVYRYNEDTQGIDLTNTDILIGKKLEAEPTQHSGYEDSIGYLSTMEMVLYTNYGEIGNFELDLQKYNSEGLALEGARYRINVVRPNGSMLTYQRDVTDDVECEGFLVTQGTHIEITEIEAPIGYTLNEGTEIITIDSIDDITGEIKYTLKKADYGKPRAEIAAEHDIELQDGTQKKSVQLKLIDVEMDTFKLGIHAIDSTTQNGVAGYSFKVETSKGAHKITKKTDEKGDVNELVGANYKGIGPIEYKIYPATVAAYYKEFNPKPIIVNVFFDLNGGVDLTKTLEANKDVDEYGKIWEIIAANTPNGNDIDIKIKIDPQDPLTVNITSVDAITEEVISGIVYEIPESVNIKANGQSPLSVGYVNPNSKQTYTVKMVDVSHVQYKYNITPDQHFSVEYDENGNIKVDSYKTEGEYIEVENASEKSISIKIKVEPKVTFTVDNREKDNSKVLQGAVFEIREDVSKAGETGETDEQGRTAIYTSKYGKGEDVKYLVKQTKAKLGYATVEDFYIKVSYSEERKITGVELCDSNGKELGEQNKNIWVTVSYKEPKDENEFGYNGNKNGIVVITVDNYPALTINISNYDRRYEDSEKGLQGTQYQITSSLGPTDTVTTDKLGEATSYLDKTKLGGTAIYTIKQVKAAPGYQSIEDLQIKLTFDNLGYISTNTDAVQFVKFDGDQEKPDTPNYATANDVNPRFKLRDNFTINVTIKNNPLLKLELNKVDETGTTKINNVEFTITAVVDGDESNTAIYTEKAKTGASGVEGQLVFNVDKTLDNTTIIYTIKETKKVPGYKWLDQEMQLEIQYDAEGKMQNNGWKVKEGNGILSIDAQNISIQEFKIPVQVKNEEIEEFGIHLIVEDRYDPSKRLDHVNNEGVPLQMKVNMRLYDEEHPDMGTRTFIPGRDDDGDGVPDMAYGEDYQSFGQLQNLKYTRIYIQPLATPNRYYKGLDSRDTIYQNIQYQMHAQVSFDDEGKITDASIYNRPGEYDADKQYLTIECIPGKYMLTIKIHYFPMVQIGINAVDKYTKQHLGNATFEVSTTYGINLSGDEASSQAIKAGYIGLPHQYGSYYYTNVAAVTYTKNYTTSTNDIASKVGFAPIENKSNAMQKNEDGEVYRRIYIYEVSEPTSPVQYQQYEPRYNIGNDKRMRRLLAYVDVFYNENGEIDRIDISAGHSIDNNNTDDKTYYIIKSEKQYDNPHAFSIDIEYKPTTTVKVHVIDEVTKQPLGDIRLFPFQNTESKVANRSYNYRLYSYYDVNSNGDSAWTYWGGNDTSTTNTYLIGTQFVGLNNKAYVLPGQVNVEVSYDETGRIDDAVVKSENAYHAANAEIVGWNQTTLEINILCSRKFNGVFTKLDKYDHTKSLSATFKIVSSKGYETTFISKKEINLGIVYPGQVVQYTITETVVPDGYLPVESFVLEVQFNSDGTIRYSKVISDDQKIVEQYEQTSVAGYRRVVEEYRPIDLRANIYDRPSFTMQVEVSDEFYNNLKVAGAEFKITNDKGDSAQGTPTTNAKGYFETYVGESYPGQTVEYTIQQINTVSGYHENNNIAKLKVTFKKDGNIEKYTLTQGDPYNYSVHNSAYVNKKYIKVNVTNMPKDVKIGIFKKDGLNNTPIQGVNFKVTRTVVDENAKDNTLVTDNDGTVTGIIDEFKKRTEPLVVKYTVSEITIPHSYRKIQDIVIQVRYNTDGRIGHYSILSNPSKVPVSVALQSNILYTGATPVHIALTIPNDNAYDLFIRDEDKNCEGLGIKGTSYNVQIGNKEMPVKQTDNDGIISYLNNTESGMINIKIAEQPDGIGEGYREDLGNKIEFCLMKGEDQYSLKLSTEYMQTKGYTCNQIKDDKITGDIEYEVELDSKPTKAIIVVNEQYGTVSVTFKNETKLELTLIKHDIEKGNVLLKDAQFQITAQQIAPIPADDDIEILTEPDTKDRTNDKGQLYFDLGVAPKQTTMRYTFKEIDPPIDPDTGEQYGQILPIEVDVTFDQYGRIDVNKGMKESSPRTTAYLGSKTGLSHSMFVEIGNGALNPTVTVKVVLEDSQTGTRLNGSIFEIQVTGNANSENLYKTTIAQTGDYPSKTGKITESGTFITPGFAKDFSGEMQIQIDQAILPEGYVAGNNATSGTIVVKKDNKDTGNSIDAEIDLSFVSCTGFDKKDITVDKENKEITVIIRNDPQVTLDLTKIYEDRTETMAALENAVFTVTSVVEDKNGLQEATDLNVTSSSTNNEGKVSINLGMPKAGKKIIYTIKENSMTGFEPLPNIVIAVTYDTNGNIKDYEILSETSQIQLQSKRNATITTYKEAEDGKRVVAETKQIEVGIEGNKILIISVENELTPTSEPYKLEIDKLTAGSTEGDSMPTLLPGAQYEIKVEEEFGITDTWEQTTNSDGKIITRDFTGYGEIRVSVTETEAPMGYQLDNTTKHVVFTRNRLTGAIQITSHDVPCEVSSDSKTVYIKPSDEPSEFTIYLYKVDKFTRFRITEPAQFDVYLQEEDSIRKIGQGETDSTGTVRLENLDKPQEPGTYNVLLRETKAPDGYVRNTEDVIVQVTFTKDQKDELIVSEVTNINNNPIIELQRKGRQYFSLNYLNESKPYIDIDIRKLNSVTKYRLVNEPVEFEVYIEADAERRLLKRQETDETGLLRLTGLEAIEHPGTVTYVIKETTTPEGFIPNNTEMRLDVTFGQTPLGEIYVANVVSQSTSLEVSRFANKYLQLDVLNQPDGQYYTLILEKHDNIDMSFALIPGAWFEITVTEEFGETRTWTDITNSDGMIISKPFKGYGNVRVDLVEKTAPDGFKIDGTERYFEFNKDKATGEMTEHGGNVDMELDPSRKYAVTVKPRDDIEENKYTLILNKIDADTRYRIQDNPATFELSIEENNTTLVLGKSTTATNGATRFDNLTMPVYPGTYKAHLKELTAPDGYKQLAEPLELEITFAEKNGAMAITGVTTTDENIEVAGSGAQYTILNILNTSTSANYELEVTKVDSVTGEPIPNVPSEEGNINDGAAIFKLTDVETQEVTYLETDENGQISMKAIKAPEMIPEGTEYVEKQYILNEIMAPKGYIVNREDIKIVVRFKLDVDGTIIIDAENVQIQAEDTTIIKDAKLEDEKIKIKIANVEGELGQNIDRGTYNIILTKIDAKTKEVIRAQSEFEVALATGERVIARSDENGKIKLLNLKAPAKAGTYEYVITEIRAPEGYAIVTDPQIFEITFEDDSTDPSKLVITNAKEIINTKGITAIDVTSFANNTVELNFEDEKDMETLYLKSKKDDIGDDIYSVYQKEDVPYDSYDNEKAKKLGKTYTFNDPVIYTKEPLQKPITKKLGTTIEEFVKNLDTNAEKITIYGEDGKEVAVVQMDGKGNITSIDIKDTSKTGNLAKTGQKLKAEKGNQELTYTVIVKGDINGDGMITTADSTKMKKMLADSTSYSDIEKAAGDVDTQGLITTGDSTKIKGILAGE